MGCQNMNQSDPFTQAAPHGNRAPPTPCSQDTAAVGGRERYGVLRQSQVLRGGQGCEEDTQVDGAAGPQKENFHLDKLMGPKRKLLHLLLFIGNSCRCGARVGV